MENGGEKSGRQKDGKMRRREDREMERREDGKFGCCGVMLLVE